MGLLVEQTDFSLSYPKEKSCEISICQILNLNVFLKNATMGFGTT